MKNHVLGDRANALEISRATNLIIGDRLYNLEFFAYFLKFAKNIRSVCFYKEKKYTISFVQLFMKIKNISVFEVVVENSGNSNITVETDLEKEEADRLIKTPEEVTKKLAMMKRIEKIKYCEKNNGAAIIKNRLNHLIPCHVNRLCDTAEYSIYSHNDEDTTAKINESGINLLIKFMP